MPISQLIDVEITISKTLTPYTPRDKKTKYSSITVKEGQELKYDDKNNELLVPIPKGVIRKVRISQSDLESFTKYI